MKYIGISLDRIFKKLSIRLKEITAFFRDPFQYKFLFNVHHLKG